MHTYSRHAARIRRKKKAPRFRMLWRVIDALEWLGRHCSWLIPLAATVFIQIYTPDAWIPFVNLSLGAALFSAVAYACLMFLAAVQGLEVFQFPAGDRCWINLLAVETCLLLVSFEDFLYLSLRCLFLGLAVGSGAVLVRIWLGKLRRRPFSLFEKRTCLRFGATCLTVFLLLPSWCAVKSHVFAAPKQISHVMISSSGRPWQSVTVKPETPDMISEEEWVELTLQERLDVLQGIVYREMRSFGITPVRVLVTDVEDSAYGVVTGQFDTSTDRIYVDLEHLQTAPCRELINTILHECRHVYQWSVVRMIDWENPEASEHAYLREARAWWACFNDSSYREKDFKAYHEREIEADARAYAQQRLGVYYDGTDL